MTAHAAVMVVHDAVNNIDLDAIEALPEPEALACWSILEDANRVLQQVRSELTRRVAVKMEDRQVVVDNVGTFVRHIKKDRRKYDTDSLVRVVLDSRLVDEATGEITDETPLDKVRHVWNLGSPRVTALRARGIDVDEFCESERGGYTIEVLR